MKRLSGGAVLLNLTDISLGLTSGEVTITDAGVLGELTELRNFIDTQRDFSKGFKSLKPVLVEYRSSASKFNGIALANLSFNTDALHMSIGVNTIQADGKMLVITINVVYAWSDYIGYTISSAKLKAYEQIASGDASFTGDVSIGGDLQVVGDTSGIKIEDLVDADGHKRFISGEMTLPTITGVTFSFAGWSLSGTHLQIVVAGKMTTDATFTFQQLGTCKDLPQWVIDKIYPFGDSENIVDNKRVPIMYDQVLDSTLSLWCGLTKVSNQIIVATWQSATPVITQDGYFRVAFDLIID